MDYKIQGAVLEMLYRNKEDMNGNSYITKEGKPFVKLALQVDPGIIDEQGFEGKLSMIDFNDDTVSWYKGMLLDGTITVVQGGAKTYYNFAPSKGFSPLLGLQRRIEALEGGTDTPVEKAMAFSKEVLKDTKVEEDDDLPF